MTALVMRVVDMEVIMFQRFMGVFVFMNLDELQISRCPRPVFTHAAPWRTLGSMLTVSRSTVVSKCKTWRALGP